MKLLSANLIITSMSEHNRIKHQLAAPVFAASIILYPLWATNFSGMVSGVMTMVPTSIASKTVLSTESASLDGFAAYASAQKTMWQLQPSTAPNAVAPSSGNPGEQAHGGLVGAAIDPAFAQANEVGTLAEYGYDTARDISRCVTLATAMIASIFSCLMLRARRKKGELTKRIIVKAIVYSMLLTGVVHLVGTFIINNFGGLGAPL